VFVSIVPWTLLPQRKQKAPRSVLYSLFARVILFLPAPRTGTRVPVSLVRKLAAVQRGDRTKQREHAGKE
jgi:hypothetical protein